MVLSHDASCYLDWIPGEMPPSTMPQWNYLHISKDVLPMLRAAGVTDAQIDRCSSTSRAVSWRTVRPTDGPLARALGAVDMAPGSRPAGVATADDVAAGARTVVLVEGFSDRVALEVLAVRRGLDLAAEGVVSCRPAGPRRWDVRRGDPRAGCRPGRALRRRREAPVVARALQRAGPGTGSIGTASRPSGSSCASTISRTS